MTSMLRFPKGYENDGGLVGITYNWYKGDFLYNLVVRQILDEVVVQERDCSLPWQHLWYQRHLNLVGVRKPERMYNSRVRLFGSLVDYIDI